MIARTSLIIAAAWLRDANAVERTSGEARLLRAGLAMSGDAGPRLLRLATHPAGALLSRCLERWLLPGIAAHYRWRKQVIAGWTAQSLSQGVHQVVVLGAGLDPMPMRLAQTHSRLQVFEIDRPQVCTLKKRAIGAIAGAVPQNLHLLHADLSSHMPGNVLRGSPAFGPGSPTLVIAEGVAMYLKADTVLRCINSLRALNVPMRIAATAMEALPGRAPRFRQQSRWIGGWLECGREPFVWGVDRARLASLLNQAGVRLLALADPEDDPSPGEWVFLGELLPQRTLSSGAVTAA